MLKSKVSLAYRRMSLDELDVFAEGTRQGLFNNATIFTTPPTTPTMLAPIIEAYVEKRAAYKNGGDAQKPAFNTAKTNLLNALDGNAAYVDTIADGNPDIITLSGYKPTKVTETAGTTPVQPVVTLSRLEGVGNIQVDAENIGNAVYYGLLLYNGTPSTPPQVTGTGQLLLGDVSKLQSMDVTKGRRKKLMGLTAGVTYTIYIYAGNPTGVSQLSEARSIMAA